MTHDTAAADAVRSTKRAWVALVLTLLVVMCAVTGLWMVRRSEIREAQARSTCGSRLWSLGQAWLSASANPSSPPRSGPAAFLALVERMPTPSPIDAANVEDLFVCPDDASAASTTTREERARWRGVDLERPAQGLCSFAVRDFASFPLSDGNRAGELIAACLHHHPTLLTRGGVNAVFANGTRKWLGYEDLGVSSADEVTVGPASKSPLLRALTYGR